MAGMDVICQPSQAVNEPITTRLISPRMYLDITLHLGPASKRCKPRRKKVHLGGSGMVLARSTQAGGAFRHGRAYTGCKISGWEVWKAVSGGGAETQSCNRTQLTQAAPPRASQITSSQPPKCTNGDARDTCQKACYCFPVQEGPAGMLALKRVIWGDLASTAPCIRT